MKKRYLLAILVGIIVFANLLVNLLSKNTETEMKAIQDYSKLCSHGYFKWEKKKHFLIHEYHIDSQHQVINIVTPLGCFFYNGFVNFSPGNYRRFPEDLLLDQYSDDNFYLPDSDYRYKDWHDYIWFNVSFDRAISLQEAKEKLGVGRVEWLWVDTYGENRDVKPTAYDTYGIRINRSIEDSQSEIQEFLKIMNKYSKKEKTVTGRKIYDIRCNIKKEGELKEEDLKIIGCVIRLTEEERQAYQSEELFKVVK